MKTLLCLLSAFWIAQASIAAEPQRPNVLFIIADDASMHFGKACHCDWVSTPNIDRLAKQGLVFENVYTPTSKCAPSRAAILTGRYPWQLEEAANHQPYFPAKYKAFTEVLSEKHIHCGGAGKRWGPGQAKLADGSPRDFAMKSVGSQQSANPGAGLSAFLEERPIDSPFFYWFGSNNPHRPYKLDSGIAAGKKLSDIDRVPAYLPDNETVRSDMLDYAMEVEDFDAQIGSLLDALDASGLTNNTLVIVTSDHGMPFPRIKGHTFDDAHHIPFIASWPVGIVRPDRRVADFINFIDLAPTFLELFAIDGQAAGMFPISGHSFTDLLRDEPGTQRPFVIFGRERNDVLARPGSKHGLGYPVRAIRQGNFLFVRNFEPDRWPCGNPDLGLKDTDDSPTKRLIEESGDSSPYWQHAFGKRLAEQLFDLVADPDCVTNLASEAKYSEKVAAMNTTLIAELRRQNDPRIVDQGAVFDEYLSPRAVPVANKSKKNGKDAK